MSLFTSLHFFTVVSASDLEFHWASSLNSWTIFQELRRRSCMEAELKETDSLYSSWGWLHWTETFGTKRPGNPEYSRFPESKRLTVLLVDAMQKPTSKLCTKRNAAWCLAVVLLFLAVMISVIVIKSRKHETHNTPVVAGFDKEFSIMWAEDHTKFLNDGQLLELMLDNVSGTFPPWCHVRFST